MAKQPENRIVDSIRNYLVSVGGKSIKTHGDAFSEIGTPDMIGVYRGRCLVVEVKQPLEEPTPIQAQRLREWAAAGAVVGVAHSLDEFKLILRRIDGELV